MKFIKYFLLDKKLYQYVATGAISAAVDFGVFMALNYTLHTHYLVNNSISFVLATLVNYLLCANVVFKGGARYSSQVTVMLTYAVSLVGLLIQSSVVYLGIEFLLLPVAIAKLGAMGSGFFWNFLSRKYWVFSGKAEVVSS